MILLQRLLREPLLHFFVVGGLFFVVFGMVSKPSPEPADRIVVGPDQIEQLTAGYQAVWRRPPTNDELRVMIDGFVREEVYYREALSLGLDRDDTVIRRRLQQKMEFMTDSGADLLEPAAGELEAYFAANERTYRHEPRLAFAQIYLGEAPAPEDISRVLNALQSDPATDPFTLGEPTLLPAELGLSPPEAIDGVFGTGFFELLAGLPLAGWSRPVSSAYGIHLVRILDSVPAIAPPLEEVHDVVLRDWKAAKALEIRELQYARLRERYVVEIPGTDAPAAEDR